MKRFVIGILAHVDAGKTTLSDTILYLCKSIRKPGRVDKKDSFLDSYALEKERGITIYSKQACFEYGNVSFTLLDTPGHVDFSPEMERTLVTLDAAVLVVSGPEGIQAHTRTLWKLLGGYDIPVFVFVNKMDRENANRGDINKELKEGLSVNCIDMTDFFSNERNLKIKVYEDISLCDEILLEEYLDRGSIADTSISNLIIERKLFPCVFGSALKQDGVEVLLKLMTVLLPEIEYGDGFAARVYKVNRDSSGRRVSFLKVTGGSLNTRDIIEYSTEEGNFSEKITEIRIYNGDRFENTDKAVAGMTVGVTGLSSTFAGEALGEEEPLPPKSLMPVLVYRVLENDVSRLRALLPKLKEMEEEDPQLHVIWNEELREIRLNIMGDIQLEILKSTLLEKYNEKVEFDRGSIIYRETLKNPVLGIGHYEPLRHYAEVQLVLEPGEAGSGIVFNSLCSTDELAANWQRLIMTHVYEKEHKGSLIGSQVDDIKITLVAGRAHLKHTEGGDFRQATYRAIRQGFMRARSIGAVQLLEPYFDFTLDIPQECTGRALNDIDRMSGKINGQHHSENGDTVVISGSGPVSELMGYSREVVAYTKGLGVFYCTFSGFGPCHNENEIIEKSGYDPEKDMRNPSYSVFCAHGSGFPVMWDMVDKYKHISCELRIDMINKKDNENGWILEKKEDITETISRPSGLGEDLYISGEEIDSIISKTYFANKKESVKNPFRKHRHDFDDRTNSFAMSGYGTENIKKRANLKKYLLVDGYNIIFAWPELNDLAGINMDSARDRLNDILSNYKAMHDTELIVVYDAYRVQGHATELLKFNNINIVFTKEAETADRFIEKFAHDNSEKYDITVATSDGLEQIIIRGQGAKLLTAMDFLNEIRHTNRVIYEKMTNKNDLQSLKLDIGTKIKNIL